MAKVSAKDKRQKIMFGRVSLKSWYNSQVEKLTNANELKNFEKFGPLNSFFYSMKVKYGNEFELKTRSEWSALYREFMKP